MSTFDEIVVLHDFRALVEAVSPGPDEIAAWVNRVAWAAHAQWGTLAKRKLRSSLQDYLNALQPVAMESVGSGREVVARIALLDWAADRVEWGWHEREGVDLRTTVIPNAKNRKQSKDGYDYVRVPFRPFTPGSSGASGSIMGEPYQQFLGQQAARALGRQVHRAASALPGYTTLPGFGRAGRGARLTEAQGGPILRVTHTTGIYTGLQRSEKTYEKAQQSGYVSFRTISMRPARQGHEFFNKGGQSWWHPGIVARKLSLQVADYVGQVAGDLLTAGD